MANACDAVSQHSAELIITNAKTVFDRFAALMSSGAEDNQSNARAWSAFNLSVAQDNQTIKQLATLGLIQAGQTGMTENQQTVSPAGTATAEAIKGTVGVAADQVAANIPALGDIVVKWAEAMLALTPVIVTAAGGASTPSQTQPKPTA